MQSIGILSIAFFALVASSSALQCSPVMCLIACPYGFETDASGCPRCSCRLTPLNCVDPIVGYSCGTFNNQECPSTHQCQLGAAGFIGQCCLKQTTGSTSAPQSTTPRPATATGTATAGTPTATTARGTTARGTTARGTTARFFRRFVTGVSGSTGAQGSGSPVPTTPSSFTTGGARSFTGSERSGSPVSTTPSSFTTGAARSFTGSRGSGSPVSTTPSSFTTSGWFHF